MKPKRKRYNVRRSYSSFPTPNRYQNRQQSCQTQSYQQQNHLYNSGTPHNSAPIALAYAPQITPNFYNNGNNWPFQPPRHLSAPSFGQQSSYHFGQQNNSSQINTASLRHNVVSSTTQFSVPPHPYQFNCPTNYQQVSNASRTQTNTKVNVPKRKWIRDDAIRALDIEEELCKRNTSAPYLVIRFPDIPLDSELVKGFSGQIEAVHFQKNSAPRFCFVRLKENADAGKVIEDISKIPFGQGHLSAELRFDPTKPPTASKPEQVDPYTLYVGNLPLSITVETIKRQFPGALRYDLAFKSKTKPIRYAFIRFESVEKSIEAFKHGINLQIEGRSLVLRFRRAKFNYSTENVSLEKDQTSNKSTPMVADLTDKNDCIITNNLKPIQSNFTSDDKVLVKAEYLEECIKEEQYDSEYSYEDECSSTFCGNGDDSEFPAIKIEMDDFHETHNSNCTSSLPCVSDDGVELGQRISRGHLCDSGHRISEVSSTMTLQNLDENVDQVKMQIINTKMNAVEPERSMPSIVSISEKKYIENLYEQLNTSKVFKKEVRSDFDDLDAMLKEID
uniref:Protein painting of fourth n=1 Tax=Bactrocera dorsalis TaxID=27457 RepID=A0A034WIE2_BACDO